MCTSASERRGRFSLTVASMLALGTACDIEPSEFRFGQNLTGLQFQLFDETAGIHPSKAILEDPNNPFRNTGVSLEARFDILASGGDVATYYAWGTALAQGPFGEPQFYTAGALRNIALTGQVPMEQEPIVRQMAINAYQSMLDNYPDAVTFDTSGTISFGLATPAFLAILELGGRVQGDWVLVATPNGGQVAVRSAGLDAPRQEPEEEEEDGS